jgi:hypothetical protein
MSVKHRMRGCKCNECERQRTYQRNWKRRARGELDALPPEPQMAIHPERSASLGDACDGCGRNEACCALNDNDCCDLCTHTFGEQVRKFICLGCRQVRIARATGNNPKRCRVCAVHHKAATAA